MAINQSSLSPAPVAQAETAVPAFTGYTKKAAKQGTDLTLTPVLITSLAAYIEYFGSGEDEKNMEAVLTNNALAKTIVTIQFAAGKKPGNHNMYYALQMFFLNGGSKCYVISVGPTTAAGIIDVAQLKKGLDVLRSEDAITLVVFPEAVQGLTDAGYGSLIEETLQQCSLLANRFAIFDVKSDNTKTVADNAALFRSLVNSTADLLSYGAAYFPCINTTLTYAFTDSDIKVTDKRTAKTIISKLTDIEITDNALYKQIKNGLGLFYITLPPASAVAGVYSIVDQNSGVWKAPANIALINVTGTNISIANTDSDNLNVDAIAGKSINPVRLFAGRGILIWGARTMAGSSNDWRYVPVRRFVMMVAESIKKALHQFATAPNDNNTWARVITMIDNYLVLLWRQGAMMGLKPSEAFFAQTGLGVTMTPQDILNGLLIIQIGIAAVRPAEFIIISISQKMMPV